MPPAFMSAENDLLASVVIVSLCVFCSSVSLSTGHKQRILNLKVEVKIKKDDVWAGVHFLVGEFVMG